MDCEQLDITCNSHILFSDVQRFFSIFNNCTTTYVYVNQNGEGDYRNTLKVKNIDDCNILFTTKGNYYYCYDGLLTNLIVWAKDPLAFGRQGFIGHHITIGWKNNNWDVHETIYSAFENARGNLLISNNKKCIKYKVVNDEIEKTSTSQESQYEEYVRNLWNEIKCDNRVNGGASTRKQIVPHDVIIPDKSQKTTLSSKQLACIILNEITHIKKHIKAAALRVPYISKHKEKKVLALITPHVKREFILWSNHNNPSSFITFGLFD